MRLEHSCRITPYFFENVGYLRFSAFFSPQHRATAEQIQTIARGIFSLFVVLGSLDFIFHFLPFKVKVVVNGTLLGVASCLVISLLMQEQRHLLNEPEENFENEFLTNPFSAEKNPFLKNKNDQRTSTKNSPHGVSSHVKRSLLPEFEKSSFDNQNSKSKHYNV